jgi:hypothetical protein
MTATVRQIILRGNALYIGIAGFAGVIFDIRGVLYGLGPQGRVLANAPYAGIGFVEAHGLAVILAVLIWRARPDRAAHLTATAVVALLGTANLAFWQAFVAMDALAMGYLTTVLHWTFVALNLAAALAAERDGAVSPLPGSTRHAGVRL